MSIYSNLFSYKYFIGHTP